jgi:hypothetical protein
MEHALAGTPDRWIDGSGDSTKHTEAPTNAADGSAPESTETPTETAPTTLSEPDDIF